MKQLNIAMISCTYLPFVGGVSISINRLSESLRKLGHKVYIFAPDYNEKTDDDEFVTRFVSYNVEETGHSVPLVRLGKPYNKFKEIDFDILHVHHPFMVAKSVLRLKKKHKIPLVYTYHTRYELYADDWKLFRVLDTMSLKTFGKIMKESSIPKSITKFCNKCDLVVSPSNSIYDYLSTLKIHTDISIVPTGLSDNSFAKDEKIYEELQDKYKDKLVFLSVLRLSYEKNIEELINNINLYKNECSDKFVHLIVGGGPLKETLQQQIDSLGLQDHVILLGSIPNELVSTYYAFSDIFVFTSKSETQGMVVLEAMAGKTPIVAHDATGVRDFVDVGVNGLLSYSNEEFVSNLDKLAKDRNLRTLYGQNAYEKALDYHSDTIAKKFVELYLDKINRGR